MLYGRQDGRAAPSTYAAPPPAYSSPPAAYYPPHQQGTPQQQYHPHPHSPYPAQQTPYPPHGGHGPYAGQQAVYHPPAGSAPYYPPQAAPAPYPVANGAPAHHHPPPSPQPSPYPAQPSSQPMFPPPSRRTPAPLTAGYQRSAYAGESSTASTYHPAYSSAAPYGASPSPSPARRLSAAEEAFMRADERRKGALDIATFERALSHMGVHSLPYAQMISVFYLSDTDQNGEISLGEFVRVAPQLLAGAAFARARMRAGTSSLDLVGLENALRILGFSLSLARVRAYYEAGDANRDYRIDFDEFWRLLERVRRDYRRSADDMLWAFRACVDAEGAAAPGRGPMRVSSEQADAAFMRADDARRGRLKVHGFARALHELGYTVGSGASMMEYFVRADSNRDGHISRDEFLAIFRQPG